MPILNALFSAVSQLFGIQKKKSSRRSKVRKKKSRASLQRSAVKKKRRAPSSGAKARSTLSRSSSRKTLPSRRPPKTRPSLRLRSPIFKSQPQALTKKVQKAVLQLPKPTQQAEKKGVLIGPVTHYFDKISVCVVNCSRGSLKRGDRIRISGKTTSFHQTVDSLQVESRDVRIAAKGQLVGLKVKAPARPGDDVFKE